jgi:hypothetical protein
MEGSNENHGEQDMMHDDGNQRQEMERRMR